MTASNGTNPNAVKTISFGTVAGVINYIVYDTFGSGGNLTGRTPDTVNNGNTWVRVGTGELTATGGYCWNNAGDNGTGISVIDVGTNAVTIEAASKISSTGAASTTINGDLMHCIVLNRDGAAFERIGLSSNASIVYQHWSGSGWTTNTTIRTLPTPVSYGDTLEWVFTKGATSCDWEVYVNGSLEQSDTGRALALTTNFVGVQVRNDEPENVDETTATAWAHIGVY